MTDAEIVARAIRERFPLVLKYEAENLASVAVAALTEAGRLVPDGCVAIERGRWERVRRFARAAGYVTHLSRNNSDPGDNLRDDAFDAWDAIKPGDLDVSET